MAKLSDVSNAATQSMLGNAVFTKGVLDKNAASAATVKTTNAIVYSVNGVMYSKAALAAQAITVTHIFNGTAGGKYVQPASTTVYYTLGLNAAQTLSVTQGTFAGKDLSLFNNGASMSGDGSVPDAPAGYTPFGVMKVVTGATTFDPATTLLDAANVTVTYFDITVLPAGAL